MTRIPDVLKILGADRQGLPMVFDKGMELVRANGVSSAHRHSIQIEINRRLYMDEATREPNEGFAPLQATLTDLAAQLADFVAAQPQRPTPHDPRRLSR